MKELKPAQTRLPRWDVLEKSIQTIVMSAQAGITSG